MISFVRTNILEIIKLFFSGILLPIVVTLVSRRYENNKLRPKLIICNQSTYSKVDNDNKLGTTTIMGYYLKQRELNNDLSDFLTMNEYCLLDFEVSDMMSQIVKSFENKSYMIENEQSNWHPTLEINKTIMKFKDNPAFIHKIKTYEAYQRCSRWTFDIRNVGKTDALDFYMQYFTEGNSSAIFINGTIKGDDSREIILYYFDNSLIIDKNYQLFTNDNKKTEFYLVQKSKYNSNDERLFKISFRDYLNKNYEYYCCSRLVKKEPSIFGVDN